MEIIIATRNLHKVREYREMFRSLRHVDVLSLLDFPSYDPPNFEGVTFEERANAKAAHAGHALQKWVIGDESGLVVPALDGAPGLASRGYAGPASTDRENCLKVLKDLQGKTDIARAAVYICCLALADGNGVKKTVSGACEGEVTDTERGNHGCGYDSIFRKHDYDKTFSEIEEHVKIRISPRRKALDKLNLYLESACP